MARILRSRTLRGAKLLPLQVVSSNCVEDAKAVAHLLHNDLDRLGLMWLFILTSMAV